MSQAEILHQLRTRLKAAKLPKERSFLTQLIAQIEGKTAEPTQEPSPEETLHHRLAVKALTLVGDVPDLVLVPYQAEGIGKPCLVSTRHKLPDDQCRVITGDTTFLLEKLDLWLEADQDEIVIVQRDNHTCTRELVQRVCGRKGPVRIVHADAFA